jgi:hypothetical protein
LVITQLALACIARREVYAEEKQARHEFVEARRRLFVDRAEVANMNAPSLYAGFRVAMQRFLVVCQRCGKTQGRCLVELGLDDEHLLAGSACPLLK